jgi:large subunit ribosomal protein L3
MSEVKEETEKTETKASGGCQLNSLFAFKVGMTSYFDDKGDMQAATVLKYEQLVVSQLKTKEKDGYEAVQVAFSPKREKRTSTAEKNHLKGTGFENGVYHIREVRQALPEGVAVGTKVDLASLKAGDNLKVTALSKGRGFAGVVKRHKVAGGPATHGSGFHRHPGSVGNRTWPGRVMPGKKFPGHMGFKNVTIKNLQVLDIVPEENVIIIRGPVPGSMNTLVQLTKV